VVTWPNGGGGRVRLATYKPTPPANRHSIMPANAASAILPPADLSGAVCYATGLLKRVQPVELLKR